MPGTYVAVPTRRSTLSIIVAGDTPAPGGINLPISEAWDQIAFLERHLQIVPATAVVVPLLTARSTTDNVGKSAFTVQAASALVPTAFVQIDAGGSNQLVFDVPAATGSAISSIVARVSGNINVAAGSGGHGALPFNMPTLALWRVAEATGVASVVWAAVTDSSANAAAYNAVHTISVSGAPVAAAAGFRYYAVLTGESGANYAASCFGITTLTVNR